MGAPEADESAESAEPAGPAESVDESVPFAPDAPRAGDDVLVFGGDAAYPPFQWIDGGAARGFVVDLADAVAARAGARADHRLGDWPDSVRALRDGEIDVVAMFASAERAEDFSFTAPFFFTSHGIYARDGAPSLSSIEDLEGSTVAIEAMSYAHERAARDELSATLELRPSTIGALRAVVRRHADYAIVAAVTADYLIEERGLALRNVGPPIWPADYVFAVSRERPDLAERLMAALNGVFGSGEYERIENRWRRTLRPGGSGAMIPDVVLAGGAGIAVIGAVVWVLRTRRAFRANSAKLADEAVRRDEAESRTRRASEYDVYTDLPRLHHFVAQVGDVLSKADGEGLASKRVVAIKLAELDQTIRALGHDAGLGMSRAFSEQLLSMGFDAYGLTGRDVFLVLGSSSEIEQRLRGMIAPADTLVAAVTPLPRTIAGAAACSESCRDPRELVRRAETALGRAERKRVSWLDYRPSLEPDSRDVELLAVFRRSGGEGLFPVFQPQVDVRTGDVVGAEVLARWDAPEFGLVPPSRFVPLLEENGIVRHLTRRMIDEGARVAGVLRDSGLSCPISVNVAVSDLLGDSTRRTIFNSLREHGAQPKDLKLELTETSFAEGAETIRWVMSRLRDSGLSISIDDFGTGFSSLSYLSDFPVDEVKLDRSFIARLDTNSRIRSIVRSTISMAHELGLCVVAEGVETEEAMRLLRDDSCDRAQGYLVSKPLAERQFIEFVEVSAERSMRIRRGS